MGQLEIAFAIDFGHDKVPDLVAAKAPAFGGRGWGYASGPLLWMAQMLGLRTVIQEQNAIPGKTNLQLSRRAQRIYVAFDGMSRFFEAKKIRCLGNPVRSLITKPLQESAEAKSRWGLNTKLKVILVLGVAWGQGRSTKPSKKSYVLVNVNTLGFGNAVNPTISRKI